MQENELRPCSEALQLRVLPAHTDTHTLPCVGASHRERLNQSIFHPQQEVSMNFHPLADRILVRRIEEQETVRGGIIIPDTAKEKPQEGEVVAIGPGRLTDDGKRITLEVKKGDRVLVGKYSGTDVRIDGTEYTILREDEVLGVLNK